MTLHAKEETGRGSRLMTFFRIFEAGEPDGQAFADLAAAAGSGRDAAYAARCMAEQAGGRRRIFTAATEEGKGTPAGFAMLNLYPRYRPFQLMEIPEIQDLFVLPDFRSRGIGRALIAACENAARQSGAKEIGIGVGLHSGFGAAQRLYVSMGYVPDGNGIVYDRQSVAPGSFRAVDDDLCLMLCKAL